MKLFSKKDMKADLKEYSNQVTQKVNDYIISHPDMMNAVIKASKSVANEDELYFWMKEVLARNPDIHIIDMETSSTDELIQWGELAYAWFNTVKRDIPLPGDAITDIEKLPVLDKKKKLDELLDSLSKETDPVKQEQIKQHITRIKNAKLLKASYGDEAICNYCGKWKPTDLTPQQLEEMDWKCDECKAKEPKPQEVVPIEQDRGSKEISRYDPEFEFLKRLVNLVVKEGVPPEEIKALSLSNPFRTIDDVDDLTAKIWTLATEKYRIPRQWLIKKLPEKKSSLKRKADLWPGQEASQPGTQAPWNYYAYTYGQDKDDSVSGPRPDDVEKKSSPETDHALAMSIGEDIIRTYFFEKGIRWSQVVQFIKDQAPQLSDADIENLKTDTKYRLEQYKIQINSKKKGLSLEKALQILEQKGPKPTHVDYTDLSIEFVDGSKMSFDEATKKAIELTKNSSAESEEQERNKDAGTGFYDSPNNYDMGKRPQGDEFIWPADTWLPRGTEEQESQDPTNVMAAKSTAYGQAWWIAPDGKIFNITAKNPKQTHIGWISANLKLLEKQYNFDIPYEMENFKGSDDAFKNAEWTKFIQDIEQRMFDSGWVRVLTGTNSLIFQAKSIDDVRAQEDFVFSMAPKFKKVSIGDADGYGLGEMLTKEFLEEGWEALYEGRTINTSLSKPFSKKAFLKISKPKSGYVDNGTGYTCGRCEYFNSDKERCKLVEGTIKSFGCCNFWDGEGKFKEKDKEVTVTKGFDRALTKEEAVYIEYHNVDYRCDECVFFDNKAKTCTKVEGEISPTASCNLWQPIPKKQSSLNKKALEVSPRNPNPLVELKVTFNGDEVDYIDEIASSIENARSKAHLNDLPFDIESIYKPSTRNEIWIDVYAKSVEEAVDKITSFFQAAFGQGKHLSSLKNISLRKQARLPSRFWIAPDGKEFPVHGSHGTWIQQDKNLKILQNYGIKGGIPGSRGLDSIWKDMIRSGWVRVSNEPAGTGFQIEVPDLHNIPSHVDDFIARNFKRGEEILIGDGFSKGVFIDNPFPSIQKAVNKELRNPVNAMLKKADVSGKQINDILALVEQTGGTTYNLQSGNLAQTPMFAVSTHKDRERIVDLVDYDTVEGYIVENQDLLNQSDKSLGAWSHDGKVYLDIVSTVPTKEEALRLANDNQQLAIFDLKNMQEIPVGIPTMPAFSKKELNIVKKAYPSKLDTAEMQQYLLDYGKTEWGNLDFAQVKEMVPSSGDWILQDIPLSSFPKWTDFEGMKTKKRSTLPIVTLGPDFDWEVLDGKHRIAVANALGEKSIKGYVYQESEVCNNPKHGVGPHYHSSSLKVAEEQILTQDQQDQIAASTSPVYNIALNNYASAVKRGHSKDRSLAYAIDSVKNLEKIDSKKLVELTNTYLKGLI